MRWNRGPLRIALHESQRYFRLVQPRLLLIGALLGVLLGLAGPAVRERGLHPDAGLYRVEIDENSPLLPVVRSDRAFDVQEGYRGSFLAGNAELSIIGDKVSFRANDEKSAAAARELQLATRKWLDAALADEPDQAAAFPVRVNVVYEPRAVVAAAAPPPTTAPAPTTPPPGDAAAEPQLVSRVGEKQLDLRPDEVHPPFPIRGLLLTFAYVVPLNFISQLYAGSLLGERTRQRGLLLLSTPNSGAEILLGKSLPYVAATVIVALVVTMIIGAGLLGLLASFPIIAFGLASTLLLGLLARSPRELTFLLVATTVLLSTFLFLPAIFTQIHPVAFLSPVSVIIASLRGQEVALGQFLYATVPMTLAAVVLASLGIALYREETLFAPRSVLSKIGDALFLIGRSRPALVLAGVLAVPFAIGLELFLLIFAVTLNLQTAFVLFLLGGAFVEEALKGLVVHAHITRAPGATRPWAAGLLVGSGFFLGEKFALVFSLVGFGLLPLGQDALATFGIARQALIVLAPLALHAVTATVTAYGARAGRTFIGWTIASLLHAAYNASLVLLLLPGAST